MKRLIPLLLVLLVSASPAHVTAADAPQAAPDPAAAAAIETLHETILDVMKNADALGYEGRFARLQPVMDRTFDMAFMAEKSAGRYWKDFTDEQKKRWLETFRNMTMANYAGQFDGYSDQRFVTLGTEPAGFDTLLVKTKLLQPNKADEDVEIDYRVRRAGNDWKIVDIYVSGTVSELALRRAEYGSVLQRDGFDKLVAEVESKIAALRAGTSD